MEFITRNCDPRISFIRKGCHSYEVTNNHPSMFSLYMVIQGDAYIFAQTIPFGDTYTVTLPGDGLYDVRLLWYNIGEELEEEATDHLIELCDLLKCYRSLMLKLYCKKDASNLIKDPCDTCEETVKENSKDLYHAMNQLNGMVITLLTYSEYDVLRYYDTTTPERTEDMENVRILIRQVKAFIASCGFDCKEGSAGTTNPSPCSQC